MIQLFFIILIIIPSISLAEESKWTTQNTLLEITNQALHIIDFSQTLQIADQPERYYERNPLLGEHPSKEKVCAYFIVGAIGHLAISYFLPEPYRTGWQMSTIIIQLPVIAGNFSIGLGIKF